MNASYFSVVMQRVLAGLAIAALLIGLLPLQLSFAQEVDQEQEVDSETEVVSPATDSVEESQDEDEFELDSTANPEVVEQLKIPPVPLRLCKFDAETGQGLAGWNIVVEGFDSDPTTYTTEDDGCAVAMVTPFFGPWIVSEVVLPGWVQESVLMSGPGSIEDVPESDDIQRCRFSGINVIRLGEQTDGPMPVVEAEEWSCTFYNRPVKDDSVGDDPEQPAQCINLLENGSFEAEVVTSSNLWQKFASVTGWVVERVSDLAATTLELHRGWSGNTAADGAQYAELDGDHSTQISQTVTLESGAVYELSWAFAARHNRPAEDNQLSVLINGTEVATEGPATMSAPLAVEDWIRNSHTFIAADTEYTFTFADAGLSDSFGTYLDDVQLCLRSPASEPEPEPEPGLPDIVNTCLLPNTLGGTSNLTILSSPETSITEMMAGHGYTIDVVADETNIQVWDVADPDAESITFNLRVLGKRAGNTQILGYYKAGDGTTFTAVLTQVADTDGEVAIPVTIPAAFASSFGFAIQSGEYTWYSETALNSDGLDHVAVFNPASNTYILAFEDTVGLGDSDYNDLVIKITDITCVPASDEEEDDEWPAVNQCIMPDTLGDESLFILFDESGEKTIAAMMAEHGHTVDPVADQRNYQVWNVVNPGTESVTFNLRVLGKRAGNTQILGYYRAGDGLTFTAVLTQVADTDGEVAIPVTIPAAFASSFGFAIQSGEYTWYSETALNSDGLDHVAVFNPAPDTFVLAFEDTPGLGDRDYNDLVIEINGISCAVPETSPDPIRPTGGSRSTGTRIDRGGALTTPPAELVLGETTTVETSDTPEGMVLGEQVSVVPVGAPDTGRGGTSQGLTMLGFWLTAPRRGNS